MLEFADLAINFVDVVHYDVRRYYFDCLIAILKRGELDLGQLSIVDGSLNVNEQKKEVAVRYKTFLQSVLKFVLKKLNVKGSSDELRRFIETFLAMAYFRIPQFRKKYLECLTQKSFGPITDWRSTELDLEEYKNEDNKPLLAVLDWPNQFYAHLPDWTTQWEQLLSGENWQNRFVKRGIAYFQIADKWVKHIYK